MTAVQLVDLGQPGILAQQIGEGAARAEAAWAMTFFHRPSSSR